MNSTPNSKTMFREIEDMVEGEVLYDDLSRTLYSSGACLYRVKPLAIVQPRNRSDVVKMVRYASRRKIPLTARGGATSRVGNELGEGIILDFSRYMSSLLEVNPQERWTAWSPV